MWRLNRNRIANWQVKAFVEATPISGPAFIGRQKVDSLAIELSSLLTIEIILLVNFFEYFREAKVSAVSPDWLTKMHKSFFLFLDSDI